MRMPIRSRKHGKTEIGGADGNDRARNRTREIKPTESSEPVRFHSHFVTQSAYVVNFSFLPCPFLTS
jgi:hypothetical protein